MPGKFVMKGMLLTQPSATSKPQVVAQQSVSLDFESVLEKENLNYVGSQAIMIYNSNAV